MIILLMDICQKKDKNNIIINSSDIKEQENIFEKKI